jgi:hypothetical protein
LRGSVLRHRLAEDHHSCSSDLIAAVAAAYDAYLHVDAAYGGGVLFSDTRRGLLAGLDRADTVALDLHKLGWQPQGCSPSPTAPCWRRCRCARTTSTPTTTPGPGCPTCWDGPSAPPAGRTL